MLKAKLIKSENSRQAIGIRKYLVIVLVLSLISYSSYGQSSRSKIKEITPEIESVDSTNAKNHKILTFDSLSFNYSESKHTKTFFNPGFKYTDSTKNMVVIQNGGPRGGSDIDEFGRYQDSSGKRYGHGIFWTRIINETNTPLDVSINFPTESFAIANAPGACFKLFLHPDSATNDRQSMYDYGITGLRSFFDTNFDKPTTLERTLDPNEEHVFFVVWLIHVPQQNGPIRAGFVLKEQELFYGISISPLGSTMIPCGQLSVNN